MKVRIKVGVMHSENSYEKITLIFVKHLIIKWLTLEEFTHSTKLFEFLIAFESISSFDHVSGYISDQQQRIFSSSYFKTNF